MYYEEFVDANSLPGLCWPRAPGSNHNPRGALNAPASAAAAATVATCRTKQQCILGCSQAQMGCKQLMLAGIIVPAGFLQLMDDL